jgi:hypothetical protein
LTLSLLPDETPLAVNPAYISGRSENLGHPSRRIGSVTERLLLNAVDRWRVAGVCQCYLTRSGRVWFGFQFYYSTLKSFAQVQNNHGIERWVPQTKDEASIHSRMDRSAKAIATCNETIMSFWCLPESPRLLDKVDLDYAASLTTRPPNAHSFRLLQNKRRSKRWVLPMRKRFIAVRL